MALKKALSKKKVFLFDLDGTLYLGGSVLPGAVDFLKELRCLGKQIFFFTNNSSRSLEDYLTKLRGLGFEVHVDELVMSTHTLIRYLKEKSLRKIYLLGTPAMKSMLRNAGIQHNEKDARAVVIGFDKTLTYEKLKAATEFIEKGCPYIVTHPDLFCPTDQGREPDCGAIAELLRKVTDKEPKVVLGKPHRYMMDEVRRRTRVSKDGMILFGDRLSTDIEMGRAYKIETVLVLSGETKRSDLKRAKRKPTYVVASVADCLGIPTPQ